MATLRPANDQRAAVERLRAVEAHAVDGATAEQMAAGCFLLDVDEEGRTVGAVALDLVGDCCTVTAAARDGVADLGEWPQVEAWARRLGARRVRLLTRRPALVRNMIDRYGFACAVLEKEL